MNNKNSKKTGGFLGGAVILLIGIFMLWSNEGRTVKMQSAINEAKKNYIQVKSDKIDEKNEGKLIATYGKIDSEKLDTLTDSTYNISIPAIKMKRMVEMYQWVEECKTDDNDEEKCTYEKEWSEELIDSSEFSNSSYSNPESFKVDEEEYYSQTVNMGAFELPERLLQKLSYNSQVKNQKLTEQYTNNVEGYTVQNNYISNVKESGPEIGDIRISFVYNSSKSVSVLAVQTDNSFKAYMSKKGESIFKIVEGEYTGEEMLQNMTESNKFMKWFLRIMGTVLIYAGFAALLNPLQVLTKNIPVLSNIVSMSTSLIASILGISLSFIIIAIAWFRFRPILSISLLAVVVCLIVGLFMLKKNKTKSDTKEKTE